MNWEKLPVFIDDLLTTLTTVWSSQKVHDEIETVREDLEDQIAAVGGGGVPAGGNTGQVLGKVSTNNYDVDWVDQTGGEGGPSNVVRFYDTMADLKAGSGLVAGMVVQTRGYYEVDDDGGAQYVIVDETELFWAEELLNERFALINEKKRVTYRMFGAHLDGVQDDGPMLVKCHRYADSIFTYDQTGLIKLYHCTVENHYGTIYKQGVDAINCNSDVDLSGSCLLVDDTNATWFGIYVWGDVNTLYYDWEVPDDVKATFEADRFSFTMNTGNGDSLPANTVLKLEETPYTARDDSGYLYTVARRELVVHDLNGVCASPLTDDWRHAGGEEINCQISNLQAGTTETVQAFTTFTASYTYITSKHGTFTGCDVLLNMSPNKYCSVMWCKRHNATVQNFTFRPRADALHNTAFKNTMVYIWDSYNVTVRNLQGFNASGQSAGSANGTSGYMLRITNCSDVQVEDCRMQGYWGATAMDSVKNIYFRRCHLNRLDIHDYFSNLWADECTLYNSSIQIGYGRGVASFTNCNFHYNEITDQPYKSSHLIEFNLTYGRVFEGTVFVDNCRIVTKNPPDNEFNLFKMEFSPNATSITKHCQFPNIICKNLDIQSDKADTHYVYFKITGSRRATTSDIGPTHVFEVSNDGTVVWQYYGRGVNWGEDVTAIQKDGILRVMDSFVDEEKKTQFYNRRYYRCTQAGTLSFGGAKPTDSSGAEFSCGTAKLVYFPDALWKSKWNYSVDEICGISPSNWYPLYLFRCVAAGTSNGYFPTHTAGTVLEGQNDPISEPDACWWTYVAPKATWCTDWQANLTVAAGQRFIAEDRIYVVVRGGQLPEHPPYDTFWFGEHDWGTARLQFIGGVHKPQAWYAKDAYCEARGNVYRVANHDGTTSGVLPTRGNPYCVDGDLIWAYKSGGNLPSLPGIDPADAVAWAASTEYEDGALIQAGTRLYIAQQAVTGSSNPTDTSGNIIMDGDRRIQFLKRTQEQWRQPATAYAAGYICWDYVTGTSQINVFAECITAGTTLATGWGPTASANWASDGTFQDGTVVWKKISDKGVWRNSGTKYPSGTIYLTDVGETDGYVRLYMSYGGVSGASAPTDSSGNEFKNGSLVLAYAQEAAEGGTPPAGNDTWQPNTMYAVGAQVVSNGNTYECVFDGRMVMPNKTVFENITSNMNNGHVFWFYPGTNIPTKQGARPWELIVSNCEGVDPLTAKGISGNTPYFCHPGNPNPVISTGSGGGEGTPGTGVSDAAVDANGSLIITLTNNAEINAGHVVGADGTAGAAGKSAYQTWLEEGNTGSEADFLAALRGDPGDPGSDGADGAPGIVWQGVWDSNTAYAVHDAVSYGGSTYLALAAHTGVTPGANPATWALLAQKGADGGGAGDMTMTVYDSDEDGKVNAAAEADVAFAVDYIDLTAPPEDGDVLVYDGMAGKFKPGEIPNTGGGGGGVDVATVIASLPAYYQRNTRWQQGGTRTKLLSPVLTVNINGSGYILNSAAEIDLGTAASWDSASPDYTVAASRAGTDFYVYACRPGSGSIPVIVLSANTTAPAGYTAVNSRKIGGFHCLCLAVGTIAGHPLSGYLIGDILPDSIWDLNHRPVASPEGMVYSEQTNVWVDIYLQSGNSASTTSSFGGSITDGRSWMDFVDDLAAVRKRLLRDDEFQVVAEGSNQQTNIQGGADPVSTGGHVDSAGRRMISNIGCEDCCGVMWQWLQDQAYRFNSPGSHTHDVEVTGEAETVTSGAPSGDITPAWSYIWLAGNKGRLYAQGDKCDVKLCAGGKWSSSANSGSRARYLSYDRSIAISDVGGRGCSAHFMK